jgi:hypothetical protein
VGDLAILSGVTIAAELTLTLAALRRGLTLRCG